MEQICNSYNIFLDFSLNTNEEHEYYLLINNMNISDK